MTASAHKYRLPILGGVLAALLIIGSYNLMARPRVDIGYDKARYRVEVADTREERTLGLSGRLRLAPNQAMLFRFEESGTHCMWMKDMNFPIDVLWLNEETGIVHIEENVVPETFPKQFCSPNPSYYVMELAAGQVAAKGLKQGDSVDICNVSFRSCYYY